MLAAKRPGPAPAASETRRTIDAENLLIFAVSLTHSPPRTTVPRLANPDQKSGVR